jgi:hypothetical protein
MYHIFVSRTISSAWAIALFQNYYNNFTLIVDKSFFIEENVHSINPEHISIKLKRCFL